MSGSQPFYCPYCGEEDFQPASEEAGTFQCASCDRAWKVQLLGVNVTARAAASAGAQESERAAASAGAQESERH